MGDDRARWKVSLVIRGASDIALSRLNVARPANASWYRRGGQLRASVTVDAASRPEAEAAAVEMLGMAQVQADVVRSKHVDQ